MKQKSPDETTDRPYEAELQIAVERLNDALYAHRRARDEEAEARANLQAISAMFYRANPDLPVPEGLQL